MSTSVTHWLLLGDADGAELGEAVGVALGAAEGEELGLGLGAALGEALGDLVGEALGDALGLVVGPTVGAPVGGLVGRGAKVNSRESESLTVLPEVSTPTTVTSPSKDGSPQMEMVVVSLEQ